MAEEPQRRALGRGLAALIGEPVSEASALERARSQRRLPIEFLVPNPRNPRKSFTADHLEELVASVRQKGVVQPILARRLAGSEERYEIIAGERRWRAAQQAGLHEVPVLIHNVSDREALELAIVENVQRADLNAMEEALGYQQLIDDYGYTQAALAEVIGKSRPHVANTLRLLRLPEPVQAHVRDGRLSAGHARALITAEDPEAVARQVVDGGLTVRETEAVAARPAADRRLARRAPAKDADTRALETALAEVLGLAVAIAHKPNGSGELRIRYGSLEQLEAVCRRLQAS